MIKLRAWINRHPLIRRFIYFFPIQLLLVQIKKNPVLILFWLLMFSFITGTIASRYGVSLLFVDPEYTGKVSILSYFIIGFSCGGFIMAYQISCYIHNAFRFPFLATCSRPFLRFCVNNFILPFSFIITYLVLITQFLRSEPVSTVQILLYLGGFIGGVITFVFGSLFYFFHTGKDMESLYGKNIAAHKHSRISRIILNRDPLKKTLNWKTITPGKEGRDWHVESYLAGMFRIRIRRARPFEHYEKEMLNRIFVQNHSRAVLFEIIVIATLFILGFFRSVPFFMIPAGASIFLLFTLYLMFTAVLNTWFRGWSNTIFILLLLIFNYVQKLDPLNAETRAYGMNYAAAPAEYSNKALEAYSARSDLHKADSLNTISILENWKKKNVTADQQKPKMVLFSCSGGGLRSSMWTFYTMQYLDSVSAGKLLPRTAMICGSSGGMLGAAYMREIWLREQNSEKWNHTDRILREQISADVLNPIAFSIAVNDWFLPLQHFNYGGESYSKNRAFAFEEEFLKNTNGLLEKKLCDYAKPEQEARIPMMVFAPTVVNDGRRMIIASQGVSYLVQPQPSGVNYHELQDAIEFRRFFEKQNADSVRFASVLRMNATFPYITPLTSLPSKPEIEVFDAGMRDNFGMENITRFLFTFRNWIAENTSGVIIVQTRDKNKVRPIDETNGQTVMQSLSRPLNSFYGNLFTVQDYNQDYSIAQISAWLPAPVDLIEFELKNEQPDLIALSWHLTDREKNKVIGSMKEKHNCDAARLFIEKLREEIPETRVKGME